MSRKRVVLAGNPNVGKSTIFNILSGSNQHTGNWAGKTVDKCDGTYKYKGDIYEIYDLPGTYSLVTLSREEEIASNFIQGVDADVMVVICNAVILERSLNLALQILALTKNVIIVVNLMDEASKKGIYIDLKKLSNKLNVPVIGCSAIDKKGIDGLKEEIRLYKKKMEVVDNKDIDPVMISKQTHNLVNEVIIKGNNKYVKRERKIDRILTSKIWGIPIMMLMLFVIFWLTIVGSNYPSLVLSNFLFSLEAPLLDFLSFLPACLTDLLVSGIYKTCAWVVGVMLPPMLIFFPLFTILEDIGFLPRIAFNLDPIFARCQSCGKQALTMCMGVGCNAVGVTGCRIFESKKMRMMAIITNSFMPCNGRYPMMIAVISMFLVNSVSVFPSIICALILVLLILVSIVMTFVTNKILAKFLYKEDNVSFVLELSDYRRVKIGTLIFRSIVDRTLLVLGRAIVASVVAGVLIYVVSNVKINGVVIFKILADLLEPLGNLMGLDGVILLAFFLGIPANEIVIPVMLMIYLGTNTLTDYDSIEAFKNILVLNNWTLTTSICFLIFTLFHFPCATTLMTIKKESSSWLVVFLSFIIPLIIGICLCSLVNFIL